MFQNFFLSLTKKRRKNDFKSTFINNKLYYGNSSIPLNDNLDENDTLVEESLDAKAKTRLAVRSFKTNSHGGVKNSIVAVNDRQLIVQIKAKTKSSNNPHCKCFELYLVEISFCDLIIISYNFIEWTLLILSRFNLIDPIYMEPVLISAFMCRFIIALNRTVILLHNWLVACMAITRCYAIYKPLNSNTNFSSKFYFRLNICVFMGLLLVFLLVNVYGVSLLSYSKPSVDSGHPECRISKEIYEKYQYIDVYINITLGVIGYSLPCFITLIINLLLIYNIRNLHSLKTESSQNGRKSVDENLPRNQRIHSTKSRSNQFFKATSSLLTLSFSYLICYIPYSFLFLLLSLDKIRMNGDIIFAFTCLRYLNHTLNFYIYFATGKRFRNDVMRFLRIKK